MRRRKPLGWKRRVAKAESTVDEFQREEILRFYGGSCGYCETRPGPEWDHRGASMTLPIPEHEHAPDYAPRDGLLSFEPEQYEPLAECCLLAALEAQRERVRAEIVEVENALRGPLPMYEFGMVQGLKRALEVMG